MVHTMEGENRRRTYKQNFKKASCDTRLKKKQYFPSSILKESRYIQLGFAKALHGENTEGVYTLKTPGSDLTRKGSHLARPISGLD